MTRAPRRRAVPGLFLLLLLLAGSSGCSDDDGVLSGLTSTSDAGGTSSSSIPVSGPVRLAVPAGWYLSPDGLTAAQAEADLAAAIPQGPLVRARVNVETTDPVQAFEAALAATSSVEAGPDDVTIDGLPGVAITIRRTITTDGGAPRDVVVRSIAVTPPTGESVLFELWSPAAQWDTVAATL
ncbi:MAG: hypothetical protein MUE34_07410, partial [Acidimicrobiales bacterium]|nr:hypothetical protein [Acidimicrobiales bacterium]